MSLCPLGRNWILPSPGRTLKTTEFGEPGRLCMPNLVGQALMLNSVMSSRRLIKWSGGQWTEESRGSAMHHMKRWLIILAAVLMYAGGFYVLFGVIFTNFLVDLWWFQSVSYGFYCWQRLLSSTWCLQDSLCCFS